MKPSHIRIIQILAELLIPILGYFFWSWSFYFISLFFILDYCVQLGVVIAKDRKIRYYNSIQELPVNNYLLLMLSYVLIIVLLLILNYLIVPTLSFKNETYQFLMYKELGIPQGVILLPLIIFGGIQEYKMNFVRNGAFRTKNFDLFWKMEQRRLFINLIALIMLILLCYIVNYSEWLYLLILSATILKSKQLST
jgi:hypothetical protein